jgi:ParB family chromosome partitioning protein
MASIQPSPRNPRQQVDGIAELADSLREHGLLQPVVVRRCGTGYELIAGHRRLEAARVLGWTEIAAVVRDETDDQAYILTLVENLQREDLTPKEEAAALEVLVRERGWTTRQVGEAIKRNHTYVSRRLRVFDDPVLAPLVLDRKLPVSTAEELLRTPDVQARRELAVRAAEGEWTVGEARKAISEIGAIRTKAAELVTQLRRAVVGLTQINSEDLTPAERKQIRQARAALGRLI